MFAHRYRYLFVLLLGGYSFVNTLYVEALAHYGLPMNLGELLAYLVVLVLLIWEGNRLAESQLPRLRRWFGPRAHPLLLMFGASIVVTLAAVVPLSLGLAHWYHGWSWAASALPLKLALTLGFRINLFLNTVNAIAYLLQQQREAQLDAERSKKIGAQAQYQALRNQVNPHFLFNSLNVLSSLVNKDQATATEFIEQLATVYRYVLQNFEKELVELRSELAFMRSYVFLLEKRFGEGLRVEIDVPPAFGGFYVLPLALQMLVENAIKHNVCSRARPLHVRLEVDEQGYLAVRNNRQPKLEKETSTQIGLENIARRYQYITKQNIVRQEDADCFIVKLPIIQLIEP
jgi:two-component system, LytTR family, sensor kinase